MREMRCGQVRRAPFIYTEVEAGAMRHGFDVQRKTGDGGRSNQRASQQVERTAELQDPEVRAELNWRVRECERKCLSVAGSTRFSKRVRVQDNRPSSTHGNHFPVDSFVIHEISSSSSFSLRRSCSPREFTFRVFFFVTKATPRFALIH
jgi:hypothetical protein